MFLRPPGVWGFWNGCRRWRTPGFRLLGMASFSFAERLKLGKQLAAGQYDQVIFIPNSLKSALAPCWAHIPQRTGWYGEWPRRLLLNDAPAAWIKNAGL